MARTSLTFDPSHKNQDISFLDSPRWQKCIRGLAHAPVNDAGPFCLSFSLKVSPDHHIYLHRSTCLAWSIQNNVAIANRMGDESLEVTQNYGTQFFSILAFDRLQSSIEVALRQMPYALYDHVIIVGFFAKGVVIFPSNLDSNIVNDPARNLVAALTPKNLSHHARLATKTSLEAGVEAILQYESDKVLGGAAPKINIIVP